MRQENTATNQVHRSEARSLCETIVKSGSKSWQQLWMSRLKSEEAKDDLALL